MEIDTAHVDALIAKLRTFHEFVNDVIEIANDRAADIEAGASAEDIAAVDGALWAIQDVIKIVANSML